MEKLAEFVNNGELDSRIIYSESEHSMISSAQGASATGVRTFFATSSQGLIYGSEIMHIISGMRLPMVCVVANRALSSPINIWGDLSDSMSLRDCGWIQLYCKNAQEAYDTILMGYKISEKLLIPVMINIDGFTLSHVYEPIELIKNAKTFLPKYTLKDRLDPNKPITMGPVGGPNTYMNFKKDQHEDMIKGIQDIKKINSEFHKLFKRKYGDGLIEDFNLRGNKKAILIMGSYSGTVGEFVKDKDIGLIRIKCFRPFPREELKRICKDLKELYVIDRAVSFGNRGVLYTEIKDVLDIKIKGFIAGLGGRDLTFNHLNKMLKMEEGWLL